MTAPAEEIVEQDLAFDETMPHVFCALCYGEGPVERAVALCGTVARKLGIRGAIPGRCLVCEDLWRARPAFHCRRCGQVPT